MKFNLVNYKKTVINRVAIEYEATTAKNASISPNQHEEMSKSFQFFIMPTPRGLKELQSFIVLNC